MKIEYIDSAKKDFEKSTIKTKDKILKLLNDIQKNGNNGIGKPEALSGNLKGYWSRRINKKDRLIYKIIYNTIQIIQCKGHY